MWLLQLSVFHHLTTVTLERATESLDTWNVWIKGEIVLALREAQEW